MKTRRELLKKLGFSAVASATGVFSVSKLNAFLNKGSDSKAPWWLFDETQAFTKENWSVANLSEIDRGASVLTLESSAGDQARVHICAHNGNPKGVAHSAFLDFVLMDGGNGNLQTDEGVGCKILTLARQVLIKELQMTDIELEKANEALALLETHELRLDRYKEEGLT